MKRRLQMAALSEDWSGEEKMWWAVIHTWIADAEACRMEWELLEAAPEMGQLYRERLQNEAFQIRVEIADRWAVRLCGYVNCSIECLREQIEKKLKKIPAVEVRHDSFPR